jgi:hypothetical protein
VYPSITEGTYVYVPDDIPITHIWFVVDWKTWVLNPIDQSVPVGRPDSVKVTEYGPGIVVGVGAGVGGGGVGVGVRAKNEIVMLPFPVTTKS